MLAQELPRSGRLAALPARGIGPPGAPGVNAGPRGPAPCQGTTGTMGEEADLMKLGLAVSRLAREVCGLVLGAVEARMPLRGRRMDSEGLAGSGWHWSTPRTF